ncbi:unnamed protein product [Paramecium primaurelia]|uniref:Transmembrane protein n=1 Tax=Paramecium primaurelia TaxID=5886 RepID=A0A8S1PQ94_PARPR|nr:unnamed protein product [Paramecium primaurelia]
MLSRKQIKFIQFNQIIYPIYFILVYKYHYKKWDKKVLILKFHPSHTIIYIKNMIIKLINFELCSLEIDLNTFYKASEIQLQNNFLQNIYLYY